ncbi:MAG TPA: CHC2 zinc finger domain-containing protein [Acidimicrobiales bacterium]|nr:CHC2 zinc finger domain-containing protein [Acidimicrobiales bacterium]
MAQVDFRDVEARHSLCEVARRTGFDIPLDGIDDVMVCCPMPGHHDNTPSMSLHLRTNRYHCFGCGNTGDVVQWVRDIYGVRVSQAVTMLPRPSPPPAGRYRHRPALLNGGTTSGEARPVPDTSGPSPGGSARRLGVLHLRGPA